MKPTKIFLLAGLLCAVLSGGYPASRAQDNKAEVALQAAIKTETVDGNLSGAIEKYQKLSNGSHRAVAAKALVRMGQCYEKLGEAQAREARKAYDRVVRDFADQKETVAAAQARLTALNRTVKSPSIVARRVWAGPEVDAEGAPSWDGRYLSFSDRNTANIALRDLATGETRDLTKNTDSRQYPGESKISPDGKQLASTWATGEDAYNELRLMGTDGFRERVLYSRKEQGRLSRLAWSPDGARIVAHLTRGSLGDARTDQIVSISAGDGSVRILKTLNVRTPGILAFSPDGRFIACDYPPREDSENRDIFLLAADGNQEVPLVQHPADDQLLGWVSDGKGVLFASDRTAQGGAWFIQVENGKPNGLPELIKPELGAIEPLGFTRSGSFYYGLENGRTDAYVAALDPAASQLTTAPARINERFVSTNQNPMFSPDGQYLAYFSNRTGTRWLLCIRSLKTVEEREFPVPPDLERLRIPRWSANGQAILVSGVDRQLLHLGFYRIDARTGETSAILSSNPDVDTWRGGETPDGKSVILARAGLAVADKASSILQHDLATGSEREIYRAPSGADVTNLALSPGGLELAFTVRTPKGGRFFDSLGVMSAQGADLHELLRLKEGETVRRDGLVWTPDGRYLLLAKAVETTRHAFRLELWRVSPRGDSDPQRIGILASDMALGDGTSGLRLHPDGKSIAFHAGQRKPEIWAMENFQPTPKADAFLNVLHELTMEAWINFAGIGPSQQTIMAKGDLIYDGVAYSLSLSSQGKVIGGVRHGHTFYGDGGDWSVDGIVSDTALRPNTWYHVACTIYSSRSASIYVNGVLSKTGAITTAILSRPTEPLYIGSMLDYGTPAHFFRGFIDEVAIFDRALSLDEIQQRYQAGLPRHKN